MVFVLMRNAVWDKTVNDVVEVEETTITRGGCRIKKDGDMVPHNGTKWIAVVPGGRMETVVIAEVNQDMETEEAMMIEEVHLDRGIDRTAGISVHGRPRRTWSGRQGSVMWI